MYVYIIYTYIIIHSLVHCSLTEIPACKLSRSSWAPSGPARLACWACLGLSTACLGLCTACPGPQDAIWTPSGRQLDASWTPVGRQLGANWTAKTAASVNVRLKDAKTAAKSHRTPCQQYFLSPDGDICNTSIYIYIYMFYFFFPGGRCPPGPP